ncbi:MAG: hypothetical protein AAGF71_00825 [Pseudomonadota bacterium]
MDGVGTTWDDLELLRAVLDWAPLPLAIALIAMAMTWRAFYLLNDDIHAGVALWLKEGRPKDWAVSFVELFDALFGKRHLSLRCFSISALFSLGTVALFWTLMGGTDLLGDRATGTLDFWTLVTVAIAVNVAVDFVSLLETRFVLGQLRRVPLVLHPVVLILDAFVTGALIWGALWVWQEYGFHTGEKAVLGEVAGGLSILTVFFYSTFITSLWTWLFILGSAVFGLVRLLRMEKWASLDKRPGFWTGVFVALVTGLFAWPLTHAFEKDEITGITKADVGFCQVFGGKTCQRISWLAADPATQLDMLVAACADGVTDECDQRGVDRYEVDAYYAHRLWTAACAGGRASSCTNLGFLYERGLGVDQDYARAYELYEQGCDGGNAIGCTNLGVLYDEGHGVDQDYASAHELYEQGCDGGNALGCTNLGYLYRRSLGVEKDYARAHELYEQGCNGGNALGCTNLGVLYRDGLGVDQDYARARELYEQGCDAGDANGCTNLAYLYELGLGVDQDYARAHQLYEQGCDGEESIGCSNLSIMHRYGHGTAVKLDVALSYSDRACGLGHQRSCERATEIQAEVDAR